MTSDNLNNDTVKNTDEEMTDWMPPAGMKKLYRETFPKTCSPRWKGENQMRRFARFGTHFIQFKKREKQSLRCGPFSKVSDCTFTKSNIPPWVFFTIFKLCKWYLIVQSIIYLE